MKKLWSFIFLLLCIALPFMSNKPMSTFLSENNFEIECYYNFYNFKFPESRIIKNGQGSIVKTTSVEYFKNLELFNYGLCGITFCGDYKNLSKNKIINELNLQIVDISTENNIYGFSRYFTNNINLENKKINTQIFISNDKVYIGSPILLGSY